LRHSTFLVFVRKNFPEGGKKTLRLTKKDRIIKFAENNEYSSDVIKVISYLLDVSIDGKIQDFMTSSYKRAVRLLFDGNESEYIKVHKFLCEKEIINLKGNVLYILPWDEEHIFKLQYNTPKRKYSKDLVKEQTNIGDFIGKYLSDKKILANIEKYIGPVKLENNLEGIKITYNWAKIEGFRLPRGKWFTDLFTFKLDIMECNTDIPEGSEPADGNRNTKAVKPSNITKEIVRYLCGIMGQTNTNGEIFDYNKHQTNKKIQELFEDGEETISIRTCYDVHAKLKAIGVLEEGIHPKRKTPYLKVVGYKEAFEDGYIVVPFAVFQKAFKTLETGSIKLFFDTIYKLNNGEDPKNKKNPNPGRDKVVEFRAYLSPKDRKDEDKKKKHLKSQFWLKRYSKTEIMNFIFGKDNSENGGLRQFFDITINRETGVVFFKIKDQYFITKKHAKKLRDYIDPLERYKKKAELIDEMLKTCAFKYNDDDRRTFVDILHRERKRVIKMLLDALDLDYRRRSERNGKPIKSLGAYMYWLYGTYKKGDKVIIYEKLYGPEKQDIDDTEDIIIDDYEMFIDEYNEVYSSYYESEDEVI